MRKILFAAALLGAALLHAPASSAQTACSPTATFGNYHLLLDPLTTKTAFLMIRNGSTNATLSYTVSLDRRSSSGTVVSGAITGYCVDQTPAVDQLRVDVYHAGCGQASTLAVNAVDIVEITPPPLTSGPMIVQLDYGYSTTPVGGSPQVEAVIVSQYPGTGNPTITDHVQLVRDGCR